MMIEAFNLSERLRVPAIVLSEEAVGHLRETVEIPAEIEVWDRKKQKGAAPFGSDEDDLVPPMPAFGEGERLAVTGSTHDPFGFRKTDDPNVHERLVKRINDKVLNRRDEIARTDAYMLEDAEVAVVAYGFTARTALFVVKQLRERGVRAGLLRLCTIWPFPDHTVARRLAGVKRVLVPEMNLGQLCALVRPHCDCDVVPLNQANGTIISPASMAEALRRIA